MLNDTRFIISDIISIYEHQSTYNPNMPLRMLGYADGLYSGYVTRHKLNKYGSTLLELPVPKLVVFYNGSTDTEDETVLRLTDSFPEGLRKESDIEIRVRMLNINYGRNKELLEACRPLSEYAWFIRRIRQNRQHHDIETAMDMALNTMPDDYSIKGFLTFHRSEVNKMLAKDLSEDEIRELFMEDGRKEGRAEERTKTEAEKERADKAESRAERAEARVRELEAMLAKK